MDYPKLRVKMKANTSFVCTFFNLFRNGLNHRLNLNLWGRRRHTLLNIVNEPDINNYSSLKMDNSGIIYLILYWVRISFTLAFLLFKRNSKIIPRPLNMIFHFYIRKMLNSCSQNSLTLTFLWIFNENISKGFHILLKR